MVDYLLFSTYLIIYINPLVSYLKTCRSVTLTSYCVARVAQKNISKDRQKEFVGKALINF